MTGLDVKYWMMQNEIKARRIAKERNCSESFVSKFLKGIKTSQPLVDYLTDAGCPENLFENGKIAEKPKKAS